LNYHNDGLNALLKSRQRRLNRLTFFGSLESVCQVELITQERLDMTARSIHEDYLQQLAPQQGSVSESDAYKQSWGRLNEQAKDANRAQADHIAYKLAMCGKLVETQEQDAGVQEALSFTAEEVEMLAQVEHTRWMAQRYLAAWRYGAQRDDQRRLHPSLVDWVMLPEAEKQKDRDVVLRIPHLARRNGNKPSV
jgi:CTP synthase (UTP-ammonia lyase)